MFSSRGVVVSQIVNERKPDARSTVGLLGCTHRCELVKDQLRTERRVRNQVVGSCYNWPPTPRSILVLVC